MNDTLYSDEEIRATLLGHVIVGASDDKLTLDDGTVLEVWGNEGCGGCSSGNYWVDEVAAFPNAITGVTFDVKGDDAEYGDQTYEVFVYAEGIGTKRIISVSGTDGNGYYGSGYSIRVRRGPTPANAGGDDDVV